MQNAAFSNSQLCYCRPNHCSSRVCDLKSFGQANALTAQSPVYMRLRLMRSESRNNEDNLELIAANQLRVASEHFSSYVSSVTRMVDTSVFVVFGYLEATISVAQTPKMHHLF